MPLSQLQKTQLKKQLTAHRHKRYEIDLKIADDLILRDFVVYDQVLRPEGMAALFLAKWLGENEQLFKNKIVIDIGCGSGIQGIVCGILGAKKVISSDISTQAVANTKENFNKFKTSSKTEVFLGDLFEKINEASDLIIFNHPFFSGMLEGETISLVTKTMIDETGLIHRFLEDAKKYLKNDGLIIMPYFEMAGPENHPKIQGEKHGFAVTLAAETETDVGIQKGNITIYTLRLK